MSGAGPLAHELPSRPPRPTPIQRGLGDMNSTFKPALLMMGGRIMGFATTLFIPVVLVRVFNQTEFGNYRQIFLIYGTLFGLAQFGMAESLYYFVPLAPDQAGRYAANALLVLSAAGLVGLGLLVWQAPAIAHLLGDDALSSYVPYVGIYLCLTIMSAVLEIVMTSRKRFFATASAYAA